MDRAQISRNQSIFQYMDLIPWPDSNHLDYFNLSYNRSFNQQSSWDPHNFQTGSEQVIQFSVVLYILAFLCGFIGNTVTIVAIASSKQMKTVATCFILNLAVADDLFIFSLPFTIHNSLTHDWPFGYYACKIANIVHIVNCYASIFTITVMSVDRYLAIVHPFSSLRYRRPRNAFIVCLLIWLACIMVLLPHWIYASPNIIIKSGGSRQCAAKWKSDDIKKIWVYFQLTIGFIVPIVVMVACYLMILHGIVSSQVPQLTERARRPVRKVTGMILAVTLLFIVCWTPKHIVEYISLQKNNQIKNLGITPTPSELRQFITLNAISNVLMYLSSCCNPFIYCISSRNFRRIYILVICRFCVSSSKLDKYFKPSNSMNGVSRMVRSPAHRDRIVKLNADQRVLPRLRYTPGSEDIELQWIPARGRQGRSTPLFNENNSRPSSCDTDQLYRGNSTG